MSSLKPGAPIAVGYEAVPASGQGPGVLVLHAWWGLNGFFRGLCDQLAEAGFVAVAPDLWGGAVATTVEEAEGLLEQRDGGAMFQAISDAIAHLGAHPAVRGEAIGAVGFSMGGAWAIYMAGVRPQIAAVAIFYSTGEGDFSASQAAYLGHFAENDEYEPQAGVDELEETLRSAGRPVTFYRYPGTGHWFFEPDRADAFNPEAARLAWERTLAFLRRLSVE